ncbi:MAG TPA: protein kinase [Thermoanaerobaculia bacterium]|nr:protein kinase [Thermoanaerobaculia bacterium]
MTLAAGTRLGPYEILSPLGAGGMGEVYKAKDARLDRTVAVKVLPQHLAADVELRWRFEREARAVSALQHPHICVLYDVGQQGDTDYLVMEYLEGESLAERLKRGPLPTEQVLRQGQQIADALDKAHKQGIVHRDLKPGNVMLTKSGVKLLDFGLAKLRTIASGGVSETLAPGMPTLTPERPLTGHGTLLGTFQYMAPEQLEGKEADTRSDLWALGCVLYEMTTGKKAFAGSSHASLISSIMTAEPQPISLIQPMTPPALDRLVRTCLAKDPDERWQSAHDVKAELQWIAQDDSQAAAPTTVTARKRSHERLAWGVAVALGAVLAISLYVALRASRRASALESRIIHLTLAVPKGERLAFGGRPFAISPDATKVALAVLGEVHSKLLLRSLEDGTTAEVSGSEDAYLPFFSPDGKWIGFGAGPKLKKVAVAGGAPIVLADAPNLWGAAWADDGSIYFVPDGWTGVYRLRETGGAVRQVTQVRAAEGEIQHRWLDVAPGAKTIVYTAGYGKGWDEAKIVAQRLDTGARRVVVDGGTSPRILPGGVLVYERAGSLSAVAFDPQSLTCCGTPVEVAKNVLADPLGSAYTDYSSSGTLLTSRAGAGVNDLSLTWIDRSGKATALHVPRQAYVGISVSADGRSAAVGIGTSIAVLDLSRETLTKIPLSSRATSPALSPDARTLYFALEKEKWYQVYSKAADGSGPETLVFRAEGAEFPLQVSLDGTRLLTYLTLPSGESEIRVHELGPAAARENRKTILRSRYLNTDCWLSPDARWVVYDSSDSGQSEVYARPIEGKERRFQISTNGGGTPIWSHSGREIFCRRGTQILAVPVKEEGSELRVGTPGLLFENHELGGWDGDPTDTRFLAAENPNFGAPQSLDVTVNWFAEVRRKLQEAKTP